jgi:hypothetical protein
VLQEADGTPSTQATAAVTELLGQLPPLMQRWNQIKSQDIPALNRQLKGTSLPELKLESSVKTATAVESSKDED